MGFWKPDFRGEYPSSEKNCAFVLGGHLHGEIVQQNPLPAILKNPRPCVRYNDLQTMTASAVEETYHLDEFRDSRDGRVIYFYVIEGEQILSLLTRALTELCRVRRSRE